jgi:hypothetical protein
MSQSPNTRRLVRWALPLIAVALLVTGLAGPIERAWQVREANRAATTLSERVAKERAAIEADFATNRVRILAGLREQIDAGNDATAMTAAGRYVFLNDPELMQLYRKATGTVSARQRTTLYRQLIERDCTEMQARVHMLRLHGHDRSQPTDPWPPVTVERITRIAGTPARAAVLGRLQEPPPHEDAPAADTDWITRMPDWIERMRSLYRARPLQEFQKALAEPDADALICVWRLEGTRRTGNRDVRFKLDLWLAPAPDGKKLEPDPVAYSERPA